MNDFCWLVSGMDLECRAKMSTPFIQRNFGVSSGFSSYIRITSQFILIIMLIKQYSSNQFSF